MQWLNTALGRPMEPWTRREDGKGSVANGGNFHVDHGIGGYRIEEILASGGTTCVFGSQRMSKAALCDFVDGLLVAIEMGKALGRAEAGRAGLVSPDDR